MSVKTSLIVAALISSIDANAECVYPGLDLSNLADKILECKFSVTEPIPNDYLISYSICNNSVRCPGIGAPYSMVTQQSIEFSPDCYYLSEWNPDIMPVLTNSNPIEYTFTFNNGRYDENCNQNRTEQISFICDPNADPYGNITCGEFSQPCNYYYKINTISACNNNGKQINHD
mmetsp:Transcript_9475/g.11877  ORF Transcript_9475/g.11877 Transcript_9475/m.11877 type:complete len:174 (+) Transcript_9475:126-647(+)